MDNENILPIKKKTRKIKKHAGGRPTVFDKIILLKLEQAYSLGMSDKLAISYAGVSSSAFYEYQKKHPEFKEWKGALQDKPTLLAYQSIVNDIKTNPGMARWWLEKKLPEEFGDKADTGSLIASQMEMFLNQGSVTVKEQTLRLSNPKKKDE